MSEPMSTETLADLLQRQAQKLYTQRVYFAVHSALFIIVMLLTEGAMFRRGRLLLAAWIVLVMLHGIILALYENRESVLRKAYRDRVAAQAAEKPKRDDGSFAFDLDDDGELIFTDFEEDGARQHG